MSEPVEPGWFAPLTSEPGTAREQSRTRSGSTGEHQNVDYGGSERGPPSQMDIAAQEHKQSSEESTTREATPAQGRLSAVEALERETLAHLRGVTGESKDERMDILPSRRGSNDVTIVSPRGKRVRHHVGSPTPHSIAIKWLRPTQWTVGLESAQRRAEYLKQMLQTKGEPAVQDYLQRKPVSCVVGPNFSREQVEQARQRAFENGGQNDTANNQLYLQMLRYMGPTGCLTASSFFGEDSGLESAYESSSDSNPTALYVVDRHHTCLALLTLKEDPAFQAFFRSFYARMSELTRLSNRASFSIPGSSDEGLEGSAHQQPSFPCDPSEPQVFVSILDDLSDSPTVESFVDELRARELIGKDDYECPIELQHLCFTTKSVPSPVVPAFSFAQMRSDPYKSLSWSARHRGFSSVSKIGRLVSNEELTEGPGYSTLHWRFWTAPSAWAAYLRNRFMELSTRASDLWRELGDIVAPLMTDRSTTRRGLLDDFSPSIDDYLSLEWLLFGSAQKVLSPAFVKLALTNYPASISFANEELSLDTSCLLDKLLAANNDVPRHVRDFLKSTESVAWAFNVAHALQSSHILGTHAFDTAAVDQACRFCWDSSRSAGADTLPGFLGHIVYQQRTASQRSGEASAVAARDEPQSPPRDFEKLIRPEEVSEVAWYHVDTIKPTQRCAGYAAVYEKRVALESHWMRGGRQALRKALMKKTVPCVIAPYDALPSRRRAHWLMEILGSAADATFSLSNKPLQSSIYLVSPSSNGAPGNADDLLYSTRISDDIPAIESLTSENEFLATWEPDNSTTGAVLFLVDHHHLSLALRSSTIIPDTEKYVSVSIALDLRSHSPSHVWRLLKRRKLCYLPRRGEMAFFRPPSEIDRKALSAATLEDLIEHVSFEVGQAREMKAMQEEQDTYTECFLPERVAELEDDPYRSIAWYVRNRSDEEGGPGFYKVNVEFFEFLWADYLRKHPLVLTVLRLAYDARLTLKLPEARKAELRSAHWKLLQGHESNPTVLDFFVRLCRHPRARSLAGYISSSVLSKAAATVMRRIAFTVRQLFANGPSENDSDRYTSADKPQVEDRLGYYLRVLREVDLRDWDWESVSEHDLEEVERHLVLAAAKAVEVLASEPTVG